MNSPSLAAAAWWAAHPRPSPAVSLLEPFATAGILASVDVHVALTLGIRLSEPDPEVLLAAALAVRAPRHEHVCLDLETVQLVDLLPERAQPAEGPAPSLPASRADWLTRVAASPLVRREELGNTPFVLRGSRLYTDRYLAYEITLRDQFRARFAESRTIDHPELLRRGLDALFPPPLLGNLDYQRLAAATAVLRGATVISGGPGTGKTWTVRNLLTLLYAQAMAPTGHVSPPRVALAAPTGKAAARVVESIRDKLAKHVAGATDALPAGTDAAALERFLSGLKPWTLHRLLGWNPENPTQFRHNASHPLPFDVVIVDEASMVDVALMAKLIDAVPPHARLVLLGDHHQLASVEAGSVLADLCGVGIIGDQLPLSEDAAIALATVGVDTTPIPRAPAPGPWNAVVFLQNSRRYASESGIGHIARATLLGDAKAVFAAAPLWPNDGPGPLTFDMFGAVDGRDVGRFAPVDSTQLPASLRRFIVDGYRPALEMLAAGPGHTPLPVFHRQVLAQFDRFRVLAAHRGGTRGVDTLNLAIETALSDIGLLHQTWSANYLGRPVLIRRNDYGVQRFNGDIGLIVRDENNDPTVVFPASDGGVEYLAPARLPEHETVFAMTIHKSQGSEFDDVVVALPDRPSAILTRELIYTGATRAKKRLTIIGSDAVLRQAIAKSVERASGLAEQLWG